MTVFTELNLVAFQTAEYGLFRPDLGCRWCLYDFWNFRCGVCSRHYSLPDQLVVSIDVPKCQRACNLIRPSSCVAPLERSHLIG